MRTGKGTAGKSSGRRTQKRSGAKGAKGAKGGMTIVLRGALLSGALTVLCLLLLALALKYGVLPEQNVPLANQVLKVLGIALAAGLCVRRGSAHPWFRGMTAGVVYILLGIVAFSIAVGSLSLSASNALDVLMGAAVGALTAVIFGKKTKPEAKKAA